MTTLHTRAALSRKHPHPSPAMAAVSAREGACANRPFAGIDMAVAAAALVLWVVLALN